MKLVYTSSGEHNALFSEKEKSTDDDLPSLGSFERENVSSVNLEDFQEVSICSCHFSRTISSLCNEITQTGMHAR